MNPSIDDTIHNLERLYTSITGQAVPSGEQPYAPIPPELDARSYVEDQMARLLAMVDTPTPAEPRAIAWAPPLTIRESKTDLVVELDLAGVSRDQVSVSTTPSLLTVTGHRGAPATGAGTSETVRLCERPFGSFRRTVPLPHGVAAEQTTAHMKDGVLEVRMPYAAEGAREARTIPVS